MSYKHNKKVIYLDTSNSFSTSRILDFLKTEFYQESFSEKNLKNNEYCLDYQKKYLEILSKIETHKIYEIFDLFSILEKIEHKLKEDVFFLFYNLLFFIYFFFFLFFFNFFFNVFFF